MNKHKDFTQGPIFKQLFLLAIPIIGTSFLQMAYNMIDMAWLGRLGSSTVAAVGTAGFFLWLGISLLLTTKVGTEIGVSQALGKKEPRQVIRTVNNSLLLTLLMAILLGVIIYFFAPQLISFFNLKEPGVNTTAVSYLRIISTGSLFYFSNPTLSSVFNGVGNSKMPFKINAVGLITNIILDPILIFGFGPIPHLGADGAAYATVISQVVVFILLIYNYSEVHLPFKKQDINLKPHLETLLQIMKHGVPVAMQSSLFAVFAIVIARITARWGAVPIAVHSIGAQIEALSWMTASGFATALAAFTGQNFGANNWDRITRGFRIGVAIASLTGLLVTILFLAFGSQVFSLFISEPDTLKLGADYLYILAWSQIFMCIEITVSGAFNGIGRTVPPSVLGIILTGSRIPLALFLSQEKYFGLYGIWWAISLSSVLKGIISFGWFNIIAKCNMSGSKEQCQVKGFIQLLPTRIRQQIIGIRKIKSN